MDRVTPATDRLSDLLRTINVRSAVYCLSDLGAPWGFRVDDSPEAKFHLVLGGRATLRVAGDDGAAAHLAAGALVLLPSGAAHVIQDHPGADAPPLREVLAEHPLDASGRLTYGGPGSRTTLLCGGFETQPVIDGLLELLPPLLVLDSPAVTIGHWLEPMSALLRSRSQTQPGSAAVFAKIADVFLTDVLRQYLLGSNCADLEVGVAVAADPVIAEAMRRLRAEPQSPWTVAGLARSVGMSRTAFAARFNRLVGEPPMTYLSKLRLSRGAGHLAASTEGVAHVARLVGFSNEASFSKAFKRRYGRSPGAFRLHAQAEPVWDG